MNPFSSDVLFASAWNGIYVEKGKKGSSGVRGLGREPGRRSLSYISLGDFVIQPLLPIRDFFSVAPSFKAFLRELGKATLPLYLSLFLPGRYVSSSAIWTGRGGDAPRNCPWGLRQAVKRGALLFSEGRSQRPNCLSGRANQWLS